MQVEPLPNAYEIEVNVKGRKVRKRLADARFDVILKRTISRVRDAATTEREKLYGSYEMYAVSKRQLSRRELKSLGLR